MSPSNEPLPDSLYVGRHEGDGREVSLPSNLTYFHPAPAETPEQRKARIRKDNLEFQLALIVHGKTILCTREVPND